MIIAIDFDGTCVEHEYPKVGKDVGAVPVLKKIVENGNKIILWTMRSGKELKDAEQWFKENGIQLYGVNINPTQRHWTTSPKAFANLYIDDAALGMKLLYGTGRGYVDWDYVETYLQEQGLIKFSKDDAEVVPWCKCNIMAAGGDMAPRMWECSRHGVTGMIGPIIIIEKAARTYTLRIKDAYDLAFTEFKRLQKEARDAGDTYFCEDHFGQDLRDYFKRTFKKK